MKKQIWIIGIILLSLIFGFCGCLDEESKGDGQNNYNSPLQEKFPSLYNISNVPYFSQSGGFCYGCSAMMMLKYSGLTEEEVQEFKDFVEENGQGGPPDIFIGFKEFDYDDDVNIGYSTDYVSEFAEFYEEFLEDPYKQITLFQNATEALTHLKILVSSDIPVIVHIFPSTGDHYVVVTGYDENNIYVNDPDPERTRPTIAIEDFLLEWVIPESEQNGEHIGFPGSYGMIWI